MNAELDPYEALRLELNKTFDMRDDYLQAPIATFTFTAPNLKVADNARIAMKRNCTIGYVEGLDVTVGFGVHKCGTPDSNSEEIGFVAKLAAGH